jgi:hypothetical protein
VSNAVQSLVQAGALVVGLAIYSVPWKRVRASLQSRPGRHPPVVAQE